MNCVANVQSQTKVTSNWFSAAKNATSNWTQGIKDVDNVWKSKPGNVWQDSVSDIWGEDQKSPLISTGVLQNIAKDTNLTYQELETVKMLLEQNAQPIDPKIVDIMQPELIVKKTFEYPTSDTPGNLAKKWKTTFTTGSISQNSRWTTGGKQSMSDWQEEFADDTEGYEKKERYIYILDDTPIFIDEDKMVKMDFPIEMPSSLVLGWSSVVGGETSLEIVKGNEYTIWETREGALKPFDHSQVKELANQIANKGIKIRMFGTRKFSFFLKKDSELLELLRAGRVLPEDEEVYYIKEVFGFEET